jgi:hypothetical protein
MQTVEQRRRFRVFMQPRDAQGRWVRHVPFSHGLAGYRRGCHCWDCREAWAAYHRVYRVRVGITHSTRGPMYHLTGKARDERLAQEGYARALAAGEVT